MQLDGMSIKQVLTALGYILGPAALGGKSIVDPEGVELGVMNARGACEFLAATGTL